MLGVKSRNRDQEQTQTQRFNEVPGKSCVLSQHFTISNEKDANYRRDPQIPMLSHTHDRIVKIEDDDDDWKQNPI